MSVQTALKPRIESFDPVVVLQSAIEEWVIGGVPTHVSGTLKSSKRSTVIKIPSKRTVFHGF